MTTPSSSLRSNPNRDGSGARPDDMAPGHGYEQSNEAYKRGSRQWRRRIGRRVKKITKLMMRVMHRRREDKEETQTEENCRRLIQVTRETPDRDFINIVTARAIFDTACSANLVTEQWLRRKRMWHLVEATTVEKSFNFVRHGDVRSRVIKEVTMEWYGENEPRKNQVVFFKDKSFTDRFLVVPDTDFDIIIGLKAINKHRLLKNTRSFYADTQGGYSSTVQPSEQQKRIAAIEDQRKKKAEQRAQRQNHSGNNNNSSGRGSGNSK